MTALLIRDVHLVMPGNTSPGQTSVLIDSGIITDIGPASSIVVEGAVLDGGGAWALAGMSDVHCHLCYDYPSRFRDPKDPIIGAVSIANAAAKLAAGVTAVRDVGAMAHRNVALAHAIAADKVLGPTVLAAGDIISAVGGHMHHYAREVSGPTEMRVAVKEQLDAGAQCIKLMVSGGIAVSGERWDDVQLTDEEIRAAVDQAHEFGVPVAAHAHPKEAILSAIRNGCDTVEHATFLDEEVIDGLLNSDVAIIPTLSVYDRLARCNDRHSSERQQAAQEVWTTKIPRLRAAYAAGVRIGIGTDSGSSFPAGDIYTEVRLLVEEIGVPLREALTMVTLGNAVILGREKTHGSLEIGKAGDLVILEADPITDLSALSRVKAVVKAGEVVGASFIY